VFEGGRSELLLQKLAEIGIPFVVSGHPTNPENVSYVAADNGTAAYHAMTHLLSLGCKRIGLIIGSFEPYHSQERLASYRKVLEERGLPVEERLIVVQDDGYQAIQQLLPHKPDAIFFATRITLDVFRGLREAGLRVPDDIALVGFDDLPLAQQMAPPLTTMRQPMAAMGKRLVEILLDIIENGPTPPRHVIFEQELVIRQSCGALRV
jgi:LacI family transcriptional regulator